MNSDALLVLLVLLFILISLFFDILGSGFTFLIGVTVLTLFGVLTPKEMLSGVANEHVAVIILLLLLGSIFHETSLLNIFFDKIFKKAKTPKGFMMRVMVVVAPLSAFLNNTPLVALLMPYMHQWSQRNKAPISKLLIPLSYAAILGGCATLIGTSTNMIVNGLVAEQHIFPDLEPLNIFDFTAVGGAMIIIGIVYMYFVGYHLLPSRNPSTDIYEINRTNRRYTIETQISAKSPLKGKTVKEILSNYKGLHLCQIIRKGNVYTVNLENTILEENDVLLFAGDTEIISELLNENELKIPQVGMFVYKKKLDIVEIVIADNSPLVNRTLQTANFRSQYDATAIAIHRNGERIEGKIGEIKLRAGDAILLLVGEKFWVLSQNTKDFYIISKIKEIRKLGWFKASVLVGGTLAVIALAALKVVSLFIGLIVLLIVLTLLGVTNAKKLGSKVDYDIGMIIVMALALGLAMTKTGAAEMLANFIIDMFRSFGDRGMLAGIYFITAIFAAFITNKAAVAILIPIALTIAKDMGIDPHATVLTVAFAAAANFMTPIGYQTNTMVYGAGGYKYRDFLKVGTPLTIIYGVVANIIISKLYL